jgi:hypothetical protein
MEAGNPNGVREQELVLSFEIGFEMYHKILVIQNLKEDGLGFVLTMKPRPFELLPK